MIENITLGQVVGGIGIITAIVVFVQKVAQPIKTFNDRIDKLESRQANDNKRIASIESDTKMILACMNALLMHAEDNNHTGDVKKVKSQLDEYLIKK